MSDELDDILKGAARENLRGMGISERSQTPLTSNLRSCGHMRLLRIDHHGSYVDTDYCQLCEIGSVHRRSLEDMATIHSQGDEIERLKELLREAGNTIDDQCAAADLMSDGTAELLNRIRAAIGLSGKFPASSAVETKERRCRECKETWIEGDEYCRQCGSREPPEETPPDAKRAYYETHEPPHCPTCDCGVPDGICTCRDVLVVNGRCTQCRRPIRASEKAPETKERRTDSRLAGDVETKAGQAPIARLIICADRPAAVRLYAPGLPPGEHDVYCEPEAVAPMLRAQRCCLAERGGGLVCTRPSGHEGQHEAWGSSADRPRYLIDCWPESSEKAAAEPAQPYQRKCIHCGKMGPSATPEGVGVYYCSIGCAD